MPPATQTNKNKRGELYYMSIIAEIDNDTTVYGAPVPLSDEISEITFSPANSSHAVSQFTNLR